MRNLNTVKFNGIWVKAQLAKTFLTAVDEPPVSCPMYTTWKVVDPADGNSTAVRIKMPFQEALDLVDLPQDGMPNLPVWMTVKVGSEPYLAKVPELDPDMEPEFRHVLKLLSLLSCQNETGRGRGYYGFGEAGTGKTSTALWLAAVLGLPVEQFNCSEVTEVDDLFVRQIPDDGKWITVDGPLLRALKHRWLCLVDEIDLAPPALPPALNDLIEGHSFSVPGYKDEVVKAASGFHLITCGNTGFSGKELGQYSGRNILDTSFKSRCIVDRYEPLSAEQIAGAVAKRYADCGLGDVSDLAKAIGLFAVDINRAMAADQIADTFSMRSVTLFMETLLSSVSSMKNALLYSLVTALPLMEEDKEFRQKAWNFFVAQFPQMADKAGELDEIWNDLYTPAEAEAA